MEERRSNRLFLSLIFTSLVIVVVLFFYNAFHDPAKVTPIPKIDVEAVKKNIENAGLAPVEAKYYKELK